MHVRYILLISAILGRKCRRTHRKLISCVVSGWRDFRDMILRMTDRWWVCACVGLCVTFISLVTSHSFYQLKNLFLIFIHLISVEKSPRELDRWATIKLIALSGKEITLNTLNTINIANYKFRTYKWENTLRTIIQFMDRIFCGKHVWRNWSTRWQVVSLSLSFFLSERANWQVRQVLKTWINARRQSRRDSSAEAMR